MADSMHLKVLLPHVILVDMPSAKVVAEAGVGAFCLLPRHIDFVAAIVPGILAYTGLDGEEHFLATDEGTLIKRGQEVLVSVRDAISGPDLAQLRASVVARYQELDERERKARTALARLEADFVRRFIELRE